MTRLREDNLDLLLPSFKAELVKLLNRMRSLGFDPLFRDGLRTKEEAAALAKKGTGIADSIHCYGAAADIICGEHRWDCHKFKCKFFSTLGREAERAGFIWGGRFTKVDQPHVQGIPIRQQKHMRAMGTDAATLEARNLLVAGHFAAHRSPRVS
jgi:hypothetical protein